MYINLPKELSECLSLLVRASLVHGFVPTSLLLCILTPLVKSSLDDMTTSANYRAIAGGCLILKVVDLIKRKDRAIFLRLLLYIYMSTKYVQ